MKNDVFNPADWVYVPDRMGRLGKGVYKHKKSASQRLTVAAFERKRAERPTVAAQENEQNINNFARADGRDQLSGRVDGLKEAGTNSLTPWDNPVHGEQAITVGTRSVRRAETPLSQKVNAPKKEEKDDKTERPRPLPPENKESNGTPSGGSSESGAGSEGTVICTELHRRGMMSLRDYRASYLYARTCLPASFMRGYQFWAIPYVAWMKRSDWAVRVIVPFVRWRTAEILYRLGKESSGSLRGKVLCVVHDRICAALGTLIGERPRANTHPLKEPAYG